MPPDVCTSCTVDTRARPKGVPDPREEPLTKPDRWVGVIPGMGRSAIYEAVRRGDLPSVRVGRHVYLPTLRVLQRLDLAPPTTDGASPADVPATNTDAREERDHDRYTTAA
jgi:hypothetical protein